VHPIPLTTAQIMIQIITGKKQRIHDFTLIIYKKINTYKVREKEREVEDHEEKNSCSALAMTSQKTSPSLIGISDGLSMLMSRTIDEKKLTCDLTSHLDQFESSLNFALTMV
jgi:hypothetical protein